MRQLKITKQITNRTEKSLDKYLHEISKIPLLKEDEELKLAERIKKGDNIALEKLTKSNLRFVVSVAKQYQNQGIPLPDLINEGNMGLMKAAEKFDASRGFKFISYAVWWIRQSILQALAENARIVRLPLNQIGTLSKVNKAFSRLEQEKEYAPSPEELSKVLEMPVSKVSDAMSFSGRHISGDTSLDENESGATIFDIFLKAEEMNPLDKESLELEVARSLATLTERESDILKLYFGLESHEHSLEEIGDMIGLTRERVRQIKEKAIRRMKHKYRSKILKEFLG